MHPLCSTKHHIINLNPRNLAEKLYIKFNNSFINFNEGVTSAAPDLKILF